MIKVPSCTYQSCMNNLERIADYRKKGGTTEVTAHQRFVRSILFGSVFIQRGLAVAGHCLQSEENDTKYPAW